MNTTVSANRKTYLLTWLILPLLLVWISVTYLVGLNRGVSWVMLEKEKTPPSEQLVSAMMPETPEIEPIVWDGGPLVTFWFDDGWNTQFTEGYTMLSDKGYTGALAVPTRLIGFDSYMTWPQVKQLQYKGWEITSHTRHHSCEIKKYQSDMYIKEELEGSLDDLKLQGLTATHFVTPCGVEEVKITDSAKKNYKSLRGTEQGLNELPIENPYDLKVRAVRNTTTREDINQWIADAEEENAWLILMFHQIEKNPREYGTTPEMMEYIVDEIAKSDLQVVLPSQVIGLEVAEEEDNEK